MHVRDPFDAALHRLDQVPDVAHGIASPAELRRRGDRRRRTRTVVASGATGLAAVVAVLAWNTMLAGEVPTRPVPPAAVTPTGSASTPASPASPTRPAPSAASPSAGSTSAGGATTAGADLSRLLLRPSDLAGVGLSGRRWQVGPALDTVFLGCSRVARAVGGDAVVSLVELDRNGRPVTPEGPAVEQLASSRLDPEGPCTGTTWTTVSNSSALLVQRYNGDLARSETPWATYRFVVRGGPAPIEATVWLGETLGNDPVALQIGQRMLARATGASTPVARLTLRTADLLPASAVGAGWAGEPSVPKPTAGTLAYLPCFLKGARPTPEETLAGALADTAAVMPSGTRQQLTRYASTQVAEQFVQDLRTAAGCDRAAERSDVTVAHGMVLREATQPTSAVRTIIVQQTGPVVSVTQIFVGDGEVPAALAQRVADGVSASLCRWDPAVSCPG